MTAQIFYLYRITPLGYNYISKFTSFSIFNIKYIISALTTTTATFLTASSFFTYFWSFFAILRYIRNNFISTTSIFNSISDTFLFPTLKSGLLGSVFSLRNNALGEQEQQQQQNKEQQKHLAKVHPF